MNAFNMIRSISDDQKVQGDSKQTKTFQTDRTMLKINFWVQMEIFFIYTLNCFLFQKYRLELKNQKRTLTDHRKSTYKFDATRSFCNL